MIVTAFVHRVDTDRFPQVPEGTWRWCVAAGLDPTNSELWLNAGAAPSQIEAAQLGESHAAAVVNALALAGVPAERRTTYLDTDPCPATAIDLPMPGSIHLE